MIERDPAKRLEQLRAKLNGRTKRNGQPQPGFKKNVEELRAEIARLEAVIARQDEGGQDG